MKISVEDVVSIRFGVYATPTHTGDVTYLQVRQFNEQGGLLTHSEDFLRLDEKNTTHLLKDGDVLFVGKGNRLFAWCYRAEYGPAIASSIFFVLRPDQSKISPEYLTAILNAPQSKSVFQQIGSGTNIFSIRKSELGAFQIPMLPMDKQKKVIALAATHEREIALTREIIKQKENLYKAVLSKLIK